MGAPDAGREVRWPAEPDCILSPASSRAIFLQQCSCVSTAHREFRRFSAATVEMPPVPE